MLVVGCTTTPTATSQPLSKVRIYAGPFLGSSPLYLANERQYFAQEGIEIESVPLKSSLDSVPALVQGDIDVVLSSANVALFNTIARGGAIRLVGGLSFYDPAGCVSHGLLVRNNLDIAASLKDPEAAHNLKLATGTLGVEGYYVDTYLRRSGLSLQDLQVEDVPAPALGEALANQGLDLANAAEPWLTRILNEGQSDFLVAAKDVLPGMPISLVVFGPRLLSQETDLGERFMKAMVAGSDDYRKGKTDANVAAIAAFTGLEPDLVKTLCWPSMPEGGALDAEPLVGFQEWALGKGAIDRVLPTGDFYDSRFVDAAARSKQGGR